MALLLFVSAGGGYVHAAKSSEDVVVVPDFIGLTYKEVLNKYNSSDIQNVYVTSDVKNGKYQDDEYYVVIDQDIAAGTKIPVSEPLTLTFSRSRAVKADYDESFEPDLPFENDDDYTILQSFFLYMREMDNELTPAEVVSKAEACGLYVDAEIPGSDLEGIRLENDREVTIAGRDGLVHCYYVKDRIHRLYYISKGSHLCAQYYPSSSELIKDYSVKNYDYPAANNKNASRHDSLKEALDRLLSIT